MSDSDSRSWRLAPKDVIRKLRDTPLHPVQDLLELFSDGSVTAAAAVLSL